jgi:hypothetical protein
MGLNGRVAEVHRARTLAAEPQAIWDVLADFGAISEWVDCIDHSCLLEHGASDTFRAPEQEFSDVAAIGSSRRVQIGRETLVERVTEFAPRRALGYDVQGLPGALGRVHVRWELVSEGRSTQVTLTNTVDIGRNPLQRISGFLLCHAMARKFDALLAALAKRIEAASV